MKLPEEPTYYDRLGAREDASNEVQISLDVLLDLFRAGAVIKEGVVDVTQGIPIGAKLIKATVRPNTNVVVLHLDRPSPQPLLRWRAL